MELIVIVEFFALIYVALPENETSKIITGQKNKPKTKYQKPTVNYVYYTRVKISLTMLTGFASLPALLLEVTKGCLVS